MKNDKIKVYQFECYNIQSDGYQRSHRWGTLDGIKAVCGVVLKETETEVDAALIGGEGLTARDFNPHAFSRSGLMR